MNLKISSPIQIANTILSFGSYGAADYYFKNLLNINEGIITIPKIIIIGEFTYKFDTVKKKDT